MRLWNAATGAEVATLTSHTTKRTSAAFSLDGTRIASASDGFSKQMWDATGAAVMPLTGHTGMVWSVAFSPSSTRIASHPGTAACCCGRSRDFACLLHCTCCAGMGKSCADWVVQVVACTTCQVCTLRSCGQRFCPLTWNCEHWQHVCGSFHLFFSIQLTYLSLAFMHSSFHIHVYTRAHVNLHVYSQK